MGYFCILQGADQSKQSPIVREFDQSGHPACGICLEGRGKGVYLAREGKMKQLSNFNK
jgi:hypothetical protein